MSGRSEETGRSEGRGLPACPSPCVGHSKRTHINNVVCDFSVGTIKDVQHSYDVVVANILANVIVDIMPDLKRITKPDGVVILSGIIEEKAQDVKNAMEKSGIVLVSETIEAGNGENWVCLVGKISA